nr:hypothetical protein [Saprospiraceae bacterium]
MAAFLLMVLSCSLQGQEVVTNERGQKIVVKADGTWQYFQGDTSVTGIYEPTAEERAFHSSVLAELATKERELSLALIRQRVKLVEILEQRRLDARQFQPEELAQIEWRIARLENELATLKSQKSSFEKYENLPPEIFKRNFNAAEWVLKKLQMPRIQRAETSVSGQVPTVDEVENGILILPPPNVAALGVSSFDTLNNAMRWDTETSRFFEHTDRGLEQDFPKGNMIAVSGFLTAWRGGIKMLNLDFVISSPQAAKVYVMIPQGAYLEIEFLDRKTLRLFNTLPDNGAWDYKRNLFISKGSYALGKKE